MMFIGGVNEMFQNGDGCAEFLLHKVCHFGKMDLIYFE